MTTNQNNPDPNGGGQQNEPLPPLTQQPPPGYGPNPGGYNAPGWQQGQEPGAPQPFNFDGGRRGGFQFRKPKRIWPYLVGLGVLGLVIMFGMTFCGSDEEEEEEERERVDAIVEPTPEPTPTEEPKPTPDVAKLVAKALADQPPVEVTRIVQVPVTRIVNGTGQMGMPGQQGQPGMAYPPQQFQPPVQQYPHIVMLPYTPEQFQQEYVDCFNPRAEPDVLDRVKWTALLDLSASAQRLWVAYYRDRTCDVPQDMADTYGEQRIAWLQNAIYGTPNRGGNQNRNRNNNNENNENENKEKDKEG